jgi:nicotinamide-nucleotide amidase
MHAEIIAVGTELTSGVKLDTNSQWLSQRLAELGIPTRYHTTVADDEAANVEVLQLALARADVVLITGGLGPTLDDLTRPVLARVLNVPLVEDPESLRQIEQYFASRGRPMPARNRVQAEFPRGATPLPNPIGSAPGLWIEVPREGRPACRLAALPGVPSEMKRMFKEQVEPRLAGDIVIRRATLNCLGLGESQIEELLGDLTRRGADPEVGITAHDATISLRIVAHGADAAECEQKIAGAAAHIRERLGDLVFGQGEEEPEHVVVRLLREQRQTVAVVEAATGGHLLERMLKVPGAEEVCRGGLVLTPRSDVEHLLGLPGLTPPVTGGIGAGASTVSGHEWARRLATAGRARFHAEIGLAVSPSGDIPIETAGTKVSGAWVGLASATTVHSLEVRQTGNPAIFPPRAAKLALDLVRRHLLGLPFFTGGP